MDETQQEIQKLLGQLLDVRTQPVGWWPPAPGWWLVALLAIVLCLFALRKFVKHSKRYQWVKLAEAELLTLESDFQNSTISSQTALSRLSVLMRRSAMAAKGRQAVARATDEQWVEIIADVGNGQGFGRRAAEMLVQAPYRAQALPDEQIAELLHNCRAWLAGARQKGGAANV